MHQVLTAGLLAVCLLLGSTGSVTAGPKVVYDPEAGGVQLVRKADVDGRVNNLLLIAAEGQEEVSNVVASVTGVLFQAAAQPDAALKGQPIRLSYTLRGEHDASLAVKIGDEEISSRAPAWVWGVAARFALHPATAAVTMRNQPETAAEKLFTETWQRKEGAKRRLTWARYHPELDDTLVGFYLIVADAMMADAERYHTVVQGLDYSEPAYGKVSLGDTAKRLRHARTLAGLVRLDSQPGDCSMLNDVESEFVFSAAAGRLQLEGVADYQFSRLSKAVPSQPGQYQPHANTTRMVRANRRLLQESSPLLYEVVDDFARHVAFFNHVQKVDRAGLETFVSGLKPVLERIPTTDTPIALPVELP